MPLSTSTLTPRAPTVRRSRPDAARYAIYYTPPPESAWYRFGCAWLGRDAITGAACVRPLTIAVDPLHADRITETPRAYGFHATLKAPFRLAPGYGPADVHLQAALLASELQPFALPPLGLATIGSFLALTPVAGSAALSALAERCVVAFDNLRAPPTAGELARRRKHRLTVHQSLLLSQWGYPYVFDEFRFHMTLTDEIGGADRERVIDALSPHVARLSTERLYCDAITVMVQPAPGAPFSVARRYALEGLPAHTGVSVPA